MRRARTPRPIPRGELPDLPDAEKKVLLKAWSLLHPDTDPELSSAHHWHMFKPVIELLADSGLENVTWLDIQVKYLRNRHSARALLALLEAMASFETYPAEEGLREEIERLRPSFLEYINKPERQRAGLLFEAESPSQIAYREPPPYRGTIKKYALIRPEDQLGFIRNEEMARVLLSAKSRAGAATSPHLDGGVDWSRFRRFCKVFRNASPDSVPWLYICEAAKSTTQYKWGLSLILELIERGTPPAGFDDPDGSLYETMLGLYRSSTHRYSRMFDCESPGEIEPSFARTANGSRGVFIFRAKGESNFLRGLCRTFVEETAVSYIPGLIAHFVENFQESLRDPDVKSRLPGRVADFTGKHFWLQSNHFRRYRFGRKSPLDEFSILVAFYRFLDSRFPDHDFLSNSESLSHELLYGDVLVRYARNGYVAAEYKPGMQLGTEDRWHSGKILFIFREYSTLTTTFRNEDHMGVDFTLVKSKHYRQQVMDYFTSFRNISTVSRPSLMAHLAEALNLLSGQIKKGAGADSDLSVISATEAFLLRSEMLERSKSLSPLTAMERIANVRAFLSWANDNGRIAVSRLALSYMSSGGAPRCRGGRAVPEEDLSKVNEELAARAKSSLVAEHCHSLFHLMLVTNLRPGALCGLKVDDIRPSSFPGEYDVFSTGKTSHGEKERTPISRYAKAIVDKAIERTEGIRARATPDEAPYVFLVENKYGRVGHVSTQSFRCTLQECCSATGTDKFSPYNLRDTRATMAFEKYLRGECSQMDYLSITGHRSIDTDTNHYIQVTLESMLEATYGLNVAPEGFPDFSDHIANAANSRLADKRSVEHGCGFCEAESCGSALLPCLICGDFKTTVEHLPFFEARIKWIDERARGLTFPHDKEDAQTEKKLYAAYVLAILKRMEDGGL